MPGITASGTYSGTIAGIDLTRTVLTTEEVVAGYDFQVAPSATDFPVPVSIPDITKVSLMVMVTDRPLSIERDADTDVRPLDNLVVLGGKAAQAYFELPTGAITVLKFTNADVANAANVKIGVVRSS